MKLTPPNEMDDATVPAATGALHGVRVIDLSRVLAGPYCTQMLGDHGADVIKVESPQGDETRRWGVPTSDGGSSAYYDGINRNKKNICLDLRSEEGRKVLWRLLGTADVVVENFKSGTMERWGFGYNSLAKRFPSLVYCQISGYGADGPLGGLPGYDAALQAYSGLMSVNGEVDNDPLRIGVPVVDIVTGMLAFSGILLSLRERERTGLGQFVDAALLDAAISILHPHSASWLATGTAPVRTGGAHPMVAPYQSFATQSGLFFAGAASDDQFAKLTAILGRPDIARDGRFLTNRLRVEHQEVLAEILAGLVREWDRDDLAAALLAAGIAASPVNDIGEALESAQVHNRQMVVSLDDYRGIASPVKLSRNLASVRSSPAAMGKHTLEVLHSLGYDTDTTDALLGSRVAVVAPERVAELLSQGGDGEVV